MANRLSMSAYQLNKLMYELRSADNVKEALANRQAVLERYRLTAEELQALEAEDLTALYQLGANPYMIRNVYRKKYRY